MSGGPGAFPLRQNWNVPFAYNCTHKCKNTLVFSYLNEIYSSCPTQCTWSHIRSLFWQKTVIHHLSTSLKLYPLGEISSQQEQDGRFEQQFNQLWNNKSFWNIWPVADWACCHSGRCHVMSKFSMEITIIKQILISHFYKLFREKVYLPQTIWKAHRLLCCWLDKNFINADLSQYNHRLL